MRQNIMNNPPFWRHWLLRIAAETGLGMIGFGGCIGAFELWPLPVAAMLGILCGVLPVELGGVLASRGANPRLRLGAAVLMLPVAALALLLPMSEVWHFILIMLSAALAEMLMIATDDGVDAALIDLTDAVRRVRAARIYLLGVIIPTIVAMMLSHGTYVMLMRAAAVLSVLGNVGAVALFRKAAPVPSRQRVDEAAALTGDVKAASFIVNFCGAMAYGALLIPMMLSRTSVGVLSATVVCFFLGMALGSLLDPLRGFYSSDRKGFSKNCALLLVMVMLFGMARMGWQWNLLGFVSGILVASAWGNLSAMRLQETPALQRLNGAAHALGALLGLLLGANAELLSRHSQRVSEFFARLTGLGEGNGYAIAFVLIGGIGALLLDGLTRRLRHRNGRKPRNEDSDHRQQLVVFSQEKCFFWHAR